jgi:hypothetical protein
MTTDRVNVGATVDGVGAGVGAGAGVGVGVGGVGLFESPPPHETRGAVMASEQAKSNAERFFTVSL